MNSKALEILREVYNGCSGIYGNLLCDAYLYGSYARGDFDNKWDECLAQLHSEAISRAFKKTAS